MHIEEILIGTAKRSPAEAAEWCPVIKSVYQGGAAAGWVMDDLAILALTTHMAALLERLQAGESIEPIDEEIIAQIDGQAMTMAASALKPAFDYYHRAANRSEIALVALHLAAAKERLSEAMSGSEDNGTAAK